MDLQRLEWIKRAHERAVRRTLYDPNFNNYNNNLRAERKLKAAYKKLLWKVLNQYDPSRRY